MGQVWDLDLPHAQAWVLMALADHADHEGANAFPGQDLLAYKTGYSPRQVRRILDALEKKNIIVAEGGGRGRGVTRRYRLLLHNAPKKADRVTGYSAGKCSKDAQPKADNLSGFSELKSGHFVQTKADNLSTFPDEKADISGAKKRTFPTQKADISDRPHDKERARVNHHEPSIEPEREQDSLPLPAIDELASTLCSLYQIPDSAGWKLRDKFQYLAIELNGVGATPAEVRAFYSSRVKKPGVEFFAGDFVTWRASQQGGASVANVQSSRPPVVVAPADWGKRQPREGMPDDARALLSKRRTP
jgi:hypothetical protein